MPMLCLLSDLLFFTLVGPATALKIYALSWCLSGKGIMTVLVCIFVFLFSFMFVSSSGCFPLSFGIYPDDTHYSFLDDFSLMIRCL